MGERRPMPRSEESNTVCATATVIRDTYVAERRQYHQSLTGRESHYVPSDHWNGGSTQRAGRRPDIWTKIAKFVLKHAVDPVQFVRYQFKVHTGNFIIKPNQLYTEKALRDYRSVAKVSAAAIAVALCGQRNALVHAVYVFQDTAAVVGAEFPLSAIRSSVLLDGSIPLSALFRYCVALQEGLPNIARRYRVAAAVQYVRDRRAYDKAWGTLIPTDFKRQAKKLYGRLAAKQSGLEKRKGRNHGEG
jgi:hypothetical protein